MFVIDWDIRIGQYKLGLLDKVNIHTSVDLLSDTAEITLPGTVINKSIDIEKKIKCGDEVSVSLGYDGELQTEFKGYLNTISTDKSKVVLKCEDALFLFRKPLANKEYKNITLKNFLKAVIAELGLSIKIACKYDFTYDKFVVNGATAYDILKKVQEETKANIYMKGDALQVQPQYVETFGEARYNFAQNIETDNLTYRTTDDQKFEVEVEGLTKKGESVKVVVGTPGGDKRSVKIYGVTDKAVLKKRGEEEVKNLSYDGFEGDFTGWLLPTCSAGYVAELTDDEYPRKNGKYYVTAVTTEVSSVGGSRKIQLGRKIN